MAPGDGETETYLGWCRAALDRPVCLDPFTDRAARFWAAFSRRERTLYDRARREGCQAVLPVLAGLLGLYSIL